LRHTSTIE